MTTLELKYNFHRLIDTINNDVVLAKFYDILSRAKDSKEGLLWAKLSKEEQDDLILIAKESQNSENLISHSDMNHKHKQWL